MNIQDKFFSFKREVLLIPNDESSKVTLINGVEYDSIERYFTDNKNTLNLVLKSQIDGQRPSVVKEIVKGKPTYTEKLVKSTVNVTISVEGEDQIRRFLDIVHPGHGWEPLQIVTPELTGMD